MRRIIAGFIIFLILVGSAAAAPIINPSVESQPMICRFYYTAWICDVFGGGKGLSGPQGLPGIPGAGNVTNYFDLIGNVTSWSNITNFWYMEGMNQTPNMTVGPEGPTGPQGIQGETGLQGIQGMQGIQGIQGIPGLDNMTAGSQGPAGEQGPQGIQGIQGPVGPMNQTANMTAGPAGEQGIQGIQGDQGIPGLDNMTAGPEGPTGPQGEQGIPGDPGTTDHSLLTNLTADDHLQYLDIAFSHKVTGNELFRISNNSYIRLSGGTDSGPSGATLLLMGNNYSTPSAAGNIYLRVPNAAKSNFKEGITISGNTDTPVINANTNRLSNVGTVTTTGDALPYDDWTTWTPTYSWTVAPTSPTGIARYQITGATCFFHLTYVSTDSNGGKLTSITLPISAKNVGVSSIRVNSYERYGNPTAYHDPMGYIRQDGTSMQYIYFDNFQTALDNYIVVVEASGFYEV